MNLSNEWVRLAVQGSFSAVVNGIVTYVLVRRIIRGLEKAESKLMKNGGKNENKPNIVNTINGGP